MNVEKREDREKIADAIEWFIENGVENSGLCRTTNIDNAEFTAERFCMVAKGDTVCYKYLGKRVFGGTGFAQYFIADEQGGETKFMRDWFVDSSKSMIIEGISVSPCGTYCDAGCAFIESQVRCTLWGLPLDGGKRCQQCKNVAVMPGTKEVE